MLWTSSNGLIELCITKAEAKQGSHTDPCDYDILALSKKPRIRKQLDKIDPAAIKAEIEGYGAWEDEELQDREANIQRLLWIACGDINE